MEPERPFRAFHSIDWLEIRMIKETYREQNISTNPVSGYTSAAK